MFCFLKRVHPENVEDLGICFISAKTFDAFGSMLRARETKSKG